MTTTNTYDIVWATIVALLGIRLGWVLRSSIRPMIEIKAEPVTPVEVELVGTVYKIQPPKSALALKLAIRAKTAGDDPTLMLETIDEWIDKAFGKSNGTKIKKRLDDANDALDIKHVMELMERVIEVSAGDPTS